MDAWYLARKGEVEQQRTNSAKKLSFLTEHVARGEELRPYMNMYARLILFRVRKALKREERYNELLEYHYWGVYESNGAYSYREAAVVAQKKLWLSTIDLTDAVFGSLESRLRSLVRGVRSTERISRAPGSLILTIWGVPNRGRKVV